MKSLKIIGIILLALVIAGGIAYGAFVFGQSQSNTTVINNTTDDGGNNSGNNSNTPSKNVTESTCNADELSLSLASADGEASAGTRYVSLVLENDGSRTCSLTGYPGVSLVNDNGNMVGSPAVRTTGTSPQTVSLNPGDKVDSLVNYPVEENFDAGTCKDGATKLRVYPPNDTGYLSIASPITGWCPGFGIGPVQAD